jgi:hypothetical protein
MHPETQLNTALMRAKHVSRSRYTPVAIDGRFRVAKRAKRLAARFREVLGDREHTVELEASIRRAAELCAIGEQLRADMLRGRAVSADDLVRVERLSAAAVRALGKSVPSMPTAPSFSEVALR